MRQQLRSRSCRINFVVCFVVYGQRSPGYREGPRQVFKERSRLRIWSLESRQLLSDKEAVPGKISGGQDS